MFQLFFFRCTFHRFIICINVHNIGGNITQINTVSMFRWHFDKFVQCRKYLLCCLAGSLAITPAPESWNSLIVIDEKSFNEKVRKSKEAEQLREKELRSCVEPIYIERANNSNSKS